MLGASARYSCFCTPVETGTPPRRRKLRIARFRLKPKAHSLRCSSSPTATRWRWAHGRAAASPPWGTAV